MTENLGSKLGVPGFKHKGCHEKLAPSWESVSPEALGARRCLLLLWVTVRTERDKLYKASGMW